jgi:hypothetical protein
MSSQRRIAAATALIERSSLADHWYFAEHAKPAASHYNWEALTDHAWGTGLGILIEVLRAIELGRSEVKLTDLWKLDAENRAAVIRALQIYMIPEAQPTAYMPDALFDIDPLSGVMEAAKKIIDSPSYTQARRTDPSTSFEAAESIRNVNQTHTRILELLNVYGPKTDEELTHRWSLEVQHRGWPTITESGLRSRRAELVAAGYVEDSGERGTTETGRACIVWQTTGKRVNA